MSNEGYPWQEKKWHEITVQQTNRQHHALLFSGPANIGKSQFADRLARGILCRDHPHLACGRCTSCHQFETGHPDLKRILAEEGKAISIDQLREIGQFLSLRSHFQGRRIVIIRDAHLMTTAGANSILKILEEPPLQALLILITPKPKSLLATIRSRCQHHVFTPPPPEQGRLWLQQQRPGVDADLLLSIAGGAPLEAVALADEGLEQRYKWFEEFCGLLEAKNNPVGISESWLKGDFRKPLYWLGTWLMDLGRLGLTPTPPFLCNPDLQQRLVGYVPGVNTVELHKVLKKLMNLQYAQANSQLILEDILTDCGRGLYGRG